MQIVSPFSAQRGLKFPNESISDASSSFKTGNTTKLNFADIDVDILNIMGRNLKMRQTILSESSSSIFDAYPTSQVLNNLSNMIQIRSESSSFSSEIRRGIEQKPEWFDSYAYGLQESGRIELIGSSTNRIQCARMEIK